MEETALQEPAWRSDWMGEAESHRGPPGWWASWETRISWPLALLEQHP